jgi:hypothetical protein
MHHSLNAALELAQSAPGVVSMRALLKAADRLNDQHDDERRRCVNEACCKTPEQQRGCTRARIVKGHKPHEETYESPPTGGNGGADWLRRL